LFNKLAALSLAAAATLSLTACQTVVESADSLVLYSGRAEELVQPLIDQFETESGISVEVRYASSAELAAQILEEGENSPMDVFFAQDAGALGAVSKAGLFEKLPDNIFGAVDSSYSSKDQLWVGVSGRARIFSYNPAKVSQIPASVFDLADPIWKGRIGIAPTNASFQSFVTAMRVSAGEEKTLEWLVAMKENAVLFEKNGAILEAVETGVVDAGLINHYYYFERGNEVGFENLTSKIGFFQSGDVGNLINVAGVGIRNTNTATVKFVEYLLSETGQKFFADKTGEYPLIDGIAPAFDLAPLRELPAPKIDLSDLDSLSETLDLIREAGLI
jgi:iron(III) transport system substrate-binding protein